MRRTRVQGNARRRHGTHATALRVPCGRAVRSLSASPARPTPAGHSAMPARAARSCYATPQCAAARGRAHRFRRQPASFLLCSGRSQKRSAISSPRKQPTVTDELVLYTNPMSRGRIVRRMLEETGLPCRVEVLDYASTMKAPAYLAVNPMGTVPAIRRNGAVLTECAALCAYLADAFPATGLAPDGPARAAYFRWLFFCRRSAGGGHCRPHALARGTRRQAGHGRLWDLCKGHGRTRTGGNGETLHRRRSLQRGGCLCRLAYRPGPAVRNH